MKRYIASAVFGLAYGETTLPYFRYIYTPDLRSAVTEVKHNYGNMYQNMGDPELYPELFCGNIIELRVKRVGKDHRWYTIFDKKERFHELSRLVEADDEAHERELKEQNTKRES